MNLCGHLTYGFVSTSEQNAARKGKKVRLLLYRISRNSKQTNDIRWTFYIQFYTNRSI